MTRQIEFANNLRTEQRNDVGTNGEFEAGKNFFGDCRAAEHMPALEYKHALARAREIRGVHQAVVTSADDDAIVFLFHSLRISHQFEPYYEVVITLVL